MIFARMKIGRCANGSELDSGFVLHAVEGGAWTAICGTKPGRLSAGWSHEDIPGEKTNCPRCLKKLATS